MDYMKAIDRARKLLRLAENAGSEEEAALAATRVADLMAEHQLTEAELRLESGDDRSREEIVEGQTGTAKRKKIAWQATIAEAVAQSLGCKMFWRGPFIKIYGRESQVQTATYTCQYLFNEIDRLCGEAWARESEKTEERTWFVWNGERHVRVDRQVSLGRGWKNAFRNGAANTIALRLSEQASERRDRAREAAKAARAVKPGVLVEPAASLGALVLVELDQAEVEQSYAKVSKGFKSINIGQVSSSGGYKAGRAAGESVRMGGGRAGLGAGQGRLK